MRIGDLIIPLEYLIQFCTLIFGAPGFGKSVFLEVMMRQLLAMRYPFTFIANHSESFHNMINWCAYNWFIDRDIEIIDPAEGKYAKGINPFRAIPGIDQASHVGIVATSLMEALGLNPNDNSVIFRLFTVIFTVMLEFQMTLDAVFELFVDRDAFNKKVGELKDPSVRALWKGLEHIHGPVWESGIAPALTRIYRVIRTESMKRFLCVL
jgi:hypothetical protein